MGHLSIHRKHLLTLLFPSLPCTVWYFFNDIYPSTHNGHRPMDPPNFWIRLFERGAAAVNSENDSPETEVHAAELNREHLAGAIPDVRPL
jgi:Derlin-2/3